MDRLIVSDYDGTIKPKDKEIFKKNIDSINNLRINDKIMISTGRVYPSIKEETTKYNIPYDYLSCANGNILFNDRDDIILNSLVSSYVLNEIKEMNKYILEIEALDAYGNRTDKPTEYLIHLIEDLKVRRKLVDKILSLPNVDYCTDGGSKFQIHVFNQADKIKTIEILKEKLELENNDIITVGDGPNDIGMITHYNGAIIGNNLDEYEELSNIPRYDTFSSLVHSYQSASKMRIKK